MPRERKGKPSKSTSPPRREEVGERTRGARTKRTRSGSRKEKGDQRVSQ